MDAPPSTVRAAAGVFPHVRTSVRDSRARVGGARTRRRGIGVVFMVALGVIVVLSVMLMSQMTSQRSTGVELSAMAQGSRAQLAAESAIAEAAYRLAQEAEGDDTTRPAFLALRGLDPDAPVARETESPYSGKPEYLEVLPFEAPLTYEAYKLEGDLSFGASLVGLLERQRFPGEDEVRSWDHRGLVAFEQEVTLAPPTGGPAVRCQARFLQSYRALAVTVPPPFSRFTAMVGETAGDDNRFRSYFDLWSRAKAAFEAGGGDPDVFPAFPIEDMEGSTGRFYVTSAAELPSAAWNVDALDTDPGSIGASELDDLKDQLAVLATGGWRRLPGREDQELQEAAALLTKEALGNRSTYELEGMADLAGYFGDGKSLELEGVVRVKGPIRLDHTVKGPCILWTDSRDGIRVKSLAVDAAGGEVVLVATDGDIQLDDGATVAASLLAPKGTVKGLAGATVTGHLLMARFPPAFTGGPTLRRPAGPRLDPPENGRLRPEDRRHFSLYFDPGFVRRDSRRTRAGGMFGGS